MGILDDLAPRFTPKSYSASNRVWSAVEAAAGLATRMLADRPARGVGPLSATPRLRHDDANHLVQIRSGALTEVGGAELRYLIPIGEPDAGYVHLVAAEAADWAERLWDSRAEAAKAVAALRTRIDALDWPGCAQTWPPLVTAIGAARGSQADRPLSFIIDVEVLGPGVGRSVERIRADSPDDAAARLAELGDRHHAAVELLLLLRANRLRGHVDATARRTLQAAGLDLEIALEHLTDRSELVFDVDHDERSHRCQLHWRDGVLRGDVWTENPDWSLMNGVLRLRETPFPTTGAVPGRRLVDLVGDHPLLPADAVITAAEEQAPDTLIRLSVPTTPLTDESDRLGSMMDERSLAAARQ